MDFETVERNAHKIIPVLHYDVNNIGSLVKTIPDVIVAFLKIAAIWTYMFMLFMALTLSIVAVFLSVFLFAYVLLPTFHRIEINIQRERNTLVSPPSWISERNKRVNSKPSAPKKLC